MVFSKGRLKFLDVFRHSAVKPHNTGTIKLACSIVFEYISQIVV